MKVTGKSRHQAADWEQTTTVIRITDDEGNVWEIAARAGGLEVRSHVSAVAVHPMTANVVTLKAVPA